MCIIIIIIIHGLSSNIVHTVTGEAIILRSNYYEQVDIIIATILLLLVPNKRHNCPNRWVLCQTSTQTHTHIQTRRRCKNRFSVDSRCYGGPTGLRADITLTTKLCLSFQTIRSRTRPTLPSWFWIMSAAAMINDGLHANIHRHKTINNGEPNEKLEILLIFFGCVAVVVVVAFLYVQTRHRTEEDEEGRKTAPRVKQSSVDFACFSRPLVG